MTWDDVGELDPATRHPMSEGASAPQARLQDMDAMGIDQTFLYPTWFAEGFHLVEDPDVAWALARAYNDWIADFCQAAPDRLFAAAMVPLGNMDFALAELRRVSGSRCFRGAFIRPMFMEGRYLTHPYYDPLWAELENLGLVAAVHPTAGPMESGVDFPWPLRGENQRPTFAGRRPRGRWRGPLRRWQHRRPQPGIPGDGNDSVGAPLGPDIVPIGWITTCSLHPR